MKKISIDVDGMSCGGCVSKIKDHFQANSKIQEINVSLEKKSVEIVADKELSNMMIRSNLIDLGFRVNCIKNI